MMQPCSRFDLPESYPIRLRSLSMDETEPFEALSARFADDPGTVTLLSGSDTDSARYHALAVWPWLTLNGFGNRLQLSMNGKMQEIEANPFDALASLVDCLTLDSVGGQAPFSAGLFGYFAYDLKDHLEDLPRTCVDELRLPSLYLVCPSLVVVQDRRRRARWLHELQHAQSSRALSRFWERLELGQGVSLSSARSSACEATAPISNFTRAQYMRAVDEIREGIADGEVYQVNLSQRFSARFEGSAHDLFTRLFAKNPAPFFAYIQAGDHQVVSSSPERFLRIRGDEVETRPIKGTRPRGLDPASDEALEKELLNSEKDGAELAMIVDLMRNDLGKVCRPGTIRVREHRRLERFDNVHHQLSIVEGRLEPGVNPVDVIRAAFPCGSITGCPKVAAMEVIDRLEPVSRHVYTGAIGYVGLDRSLDLSVAIRTAVIKDHRLVFSVGGGVVHDSTPEEEYEESLHKARTLIDVLKRPAGIDSEGSKEAVIWLNGRFLPSARARLPITMLGVQYGFGFFETLRADAAHVHRLPSHLQRFHETWRELFETEPPHVKWAAVMHQVLMENQLGSSAAAIKMMALAGEPDDFRMNVSLAVLARSIPGKPWTDAARGCTLLVYPEPRQTPLARHKTTNYLYCFLAGKWARQRGADQALILNANRTVSETHIANLILVEGHTVSIPESLAVLPGTMSRAVCAWLQARGMTLVRKPLTVERLLRHQGVLLATNAVMGAVPVRALDGHALPVETDMWQEINRDLFSWDESAGLPGD